MLNFLISNPITRFFKNVVGPAAIIAAGMIGAGAVATRLLAGAWFGMELLWAALLVIPMVIFSLDSASRVGILSHHRGIMEMIKSEIHLSLAWFFFILTFFISIITNMSQMSVMIEATYGALGFSLPPGGKTSMGMVVTMFILLAITLFLVLFGGYRRIEKLMTGLLLTILVAFIIVAVKGLMDWQTWIAFGKGLIPQIPSDLPVLGTEKVRSGFTQLMAIVGQALPGSVFLSYGYFTSDAEYTEKDIKRSFWKSVQHFGIIWGLFSVVVVVAGATILHKTYISTVPVADQIVHYSQIDQVYTAGRVITPAFPNAISFLAPRIFSVGLLAAAFTTTISVAMVIVYFTLDILGKEWKFKEQNRNFQWGLGLWIAVPGILAPFWQIPALIKAILAMAGSLILAPVALMIIIYFINKKSYMGKYAANIGRNIILGITFGFSLFVFVYGIIRLF